jgi:2',3'-cyclic-nucleotide 2'-phosphodiesterase (5'-nucleotidase family)
MGGLARRATFIKAVRAGAQNAHVLLLDGGDTLWGDFPSPSTTHTQGWVMVEAMNLMGYDAMALGAADLRLGPAILGELDADAQFRMVSVNVRRPATHYESEDPPLLSPYALVEVGGRKVGIVGLTRVVLGSPFGLLLVVDPAGVLPAHLKQLQAQTDIVIVLSSLGWDDNVRLAEMMPGIDLIISSGGTDVLNESWQSAQTGTIVWQLGTHAREHPGWTVNMIKLTVDGSGLVIGHSESFSDLGPEVADDPEMRQLLDSYQPR